MSGRPIVIRQREAKQLIAAARQAGAKKVEFRIDDVPVIIHLDVEDEEPAASEEQITL